MKLIQKSNFMVQGMFFQQLYCITIVLHLYLEIMCSACISYYLAITIPRITATISVIKDLHYNFPKMRGGSKAVWNFSDLVSSPFPLYAK